MNASKENAREALRLFTEVITFEDTASSVEDDVIQNEAHAFIVGFLKAAERKLPTEAAFARDKANSRRR